MSAVPAALGGGDSRGASSLLTWRALTILTTAVAVLGPLSLIVYQSFLTAPFFDARKTIGIEAYEFVFADADFWKALLNSVLIAKSSTSPPIIFCPRCEST
ncbi:MAG TPA: hypothetical protein VF348_11120 [Usitatibacter sp.]